MQSLKLDNNDNDIKINDKQANISSIENGFYRKNQDTKILPDRHHLLYQRRRQMREYSFSGGQGSGSRIRSLEGCAAYRFEIVIH